MIKKDYISRVPQEPRIIIDLDRIEEYVKGALYIGGTAAALGYVFARCLFPELIP
jgi:TRAP-type C4-dicarboxylate transport system permease small subunit